MSYPEGSKVWSKLVLIASVICIFCVLLAILGVRFGAFNFRVASDMLESTFQAAVAVFMVAVIIFVGEAETRLKTGAAIIILLFPIVGIWMNDTSNAKLDEKGNVLAPLNDISTDVRNPPRYDAVIKLRPEGSNSLEYPAESAETQLERFPSIKTIQSTLTKEAAFDKALMIVSSSGWQLVYHDKEKGKIEAVASTFFFDFKDDVVIRVQAEGENSIVDIRSHSRLGKSDRGKNAERILSFIQAFKS